MSLNLLYDKVDRWTRNVMKDEWMFRFRGKSQFWDKPCEQSGQYYDVVAPLEKIAQIHIFAKHSHRE